MIRVYITSTAGGSTGLDAQREATERLLRFALYGHTGAAGELPERASGSHGKPYFPQLPSFHFNLSHSGAYAVLAAGNEETGVDIERIREVSGRIAQRFLGGVTGDAAALIREWTRRESYGKFTGEGFFAALPRRPHVFTGIDAPPGYIITVCTSSGNVDRRIIRL